MEFAAETEAANGQRFSFEGLRPGEYEVEVDAWTSTGRRLLRLPPILIEGTLERDVNIPDKDEP